MATAALAIAPGLSVEGIRHGMTGGGTRLVIDLNQKVDYRAFLLENPYRLVVDVPAANWAVPRQNFLSDQVLKGYRSGTLDKEGLTRIVFDLRKPAIVSKAFVLEKKGSNKDRLVLDLHTASANLFKARTTDLFGSRNLQNPSTTTVSVPLYRPAQQAVETALEPPAIFQNASAVTPGVPGRKPPVFNHQRSKKYTIVIDAGHGGADPGAIGINGTREKNITLAAARELKRQLEETGQYKVVLTRDRDTYIRLHDRLNISRKSGGDLFISLHADKVDRRGVRGASIYTLSETASDTETARLADQENNAGIVAGVDLASESQDVANILLDLAMREKMNESSLFARYLRDSMDRKKIRLLPNSHRSAGFAVLKAPDVPAVLIEIGFLSNPEEEKILNSSEFHRRISNSIVDGINAYFRKIQALQKI